MSKFEEKNVYKSIAVRFVLELAVMQILHLFASEHPTIFNLIQFCITTRVFSFIVCDDTVKILSTFKHLSQRREMV